MFRILLQLRIPKAEFTEIVGNINISGNLVTLYPATGGSMVFPLSLVAFIKIYDTVERGG